MGNINSNDLDEIESQRSHDYHRDEYKTELDRKQPRVSAKPIPIHSPTSKSSNSDFFSQYELGTIIGKLVLKLFYEFLLN